MRAGLLRYIALVSAGLSCGPAPAAPDAGAEEPRVDAGSDPNPLCPGPVEPDTSEVARLSLPARTRSMLQGVYHIASIDRSTRTRVVAEGGVTLALGPGYPSTVTVTLDAVVDPRCCCDP